jgi:hypothetical protein
MGKNEEIAKAEDGTSRTPRQKDGDESYGEEANVVQNSTRPHSTENIYVCRKSVTGGRRHWEEVLKGASMGSQDPNRPAGPRTIRNTLLTELINSTGTSLHCRYHCRRQDIMVYTYSCLFRNIILIQAMTASLHALFNSSLSHPTSRRKLPDWLTDFMELRPWETANCAAT